MSKAVDVNSIEFKQLKTKRPQVYGNKVWIQYPDQVEGVSTDDDTLFRMKEVYAMADCENCGYLGRRQFKDLLDLLGIVVDDDMLFQMFNDMDENVDGKITFDEFAKAMVEHLDPANLETLASVQPGAMGTRMWTRGQIIWGANTGLILTTVGMAIAGLVFFQFILVPVILSYFFVFLVAPLMDLLEHRPLNCGKKKLCDPYEPDPDKPGETRYANEARQEMEEQGTSKAVFFDTFTLGVVPHGLSVLLCIAIVMGFFYLVVVMISTEVGNLTADEKFMDALEQKVDDVYASLNSSGMKILRNDRPEGYTEAELAGIGAALNAFVGQVGLIFLLTVYIMGEKTQKDLFHNNVIMEEVEAQVKYYIVLKTAISLLTGIIVGVILLILQVKLAIMWGLLSFLLNYIPNVGSMIAMFLPMPIVLVDPDMATWQQVGAFVGPGLVQGYVGNVLEPMLFGASLNMTPLAILAALAIWGSIWGLVGAVLSVPLLAVQKICLIHANHPLAKTFLMCIREDATVDENAEAAGGDEVVIDDELSDDK